MVVRSSNIPPSALEPERPWERQRAEPDCAWEGFVAYRELGPGHRSLSAAAAKMGKKSSTLERWSRNWDWVARCHAYDVWVDRETKLAEITAIKDMRRRHIEFAMSFQGAAALALNKIIAAEKARTEDGKPGPLTLKPTEVKELAELGLRLERLNRGEPSEIEKLTIDAPPASVLDYSALSMEELRTLRALTLKARGGL